ncbi:hypothetical protein SMIDD28_00824 [Streptococcus mitis]|uniref:Uncharacterized protein n=1 Tax=Streptococcus mitis TaxID=28037 RepID=A0A139Q9G7_STRMT|nr:hypothetical protein SMIDD28_00824 [Streptococcus mitis]
MEIQAQAVVHQTNSPNQYKSLLRFVFFELESGNDSVKTVKFEGL